MQWHAHTYLAAKLLVEGLGNLPLFVILEVVEGSEAHVGQPVRAEHQAGSTTSPFLARKCEDGGGKLAVVGKRVALSLKTCACAWNGDHDRSDDVTEASTPMVGTQTNTAGVARIHEQVKPNRAPKAPIYLDY